jgi:hypothetical protein
MTTTERRRCRPSNARRGATRDGHPNDWCREDQVCWSDATFVPSSLERKHGDKYGAYPPRRGGDGTPGPRSRGRVPAFERHPDPPGELAGSDRSLPQPDPGRGGPTPGRTAGDSETGAVDTTRQRLGSNPRHRAATRSLVAGRVVRCARTGWLPSFPGTALSAGAGGWLRFWRS